MTTRTSVAAATVTATSKVAQVTLVFWIMKICATTLGETAGDQLSMTMHLGYGASTLLLLTVFVITLVMQMSAARFHPVLYWAVILSTSTAGTTLSDFMDRTLHLGYARGAALLAALLLAVLALWRASTGSLAVDGIHSRRVESFYWAAILVSNTLGTALGDFLADDSGLGFLGSAVLIGAGIGLAALAWRFTRLNRVVLFWVAFVLTRPFGATFGDLLTKPMDAGGLALGTAAASMVLAVPLVALVIWSSWRIRQTPADA